MMRTYDLYTRLSKRPLGPQVFSVLYALEAPYFCTVRPQVRAMGLLAEVPVRVKAVRRDGVVAVEGVITIRTSARPGR